MSHLGATLEAVDAELVERQVELAEHAWTARVRAAEVTEMARRVRSRTVETRIKIEHTHARVASLLGGK